MKMEKLLYIPQNFDQYNASNVLNEITFAI
ncbi:hypothetical protein LOK49_LG06G02257 [Camellia lanceoleosa]|uniref:Uncharacterized protein n=1 Tax=Camellia lanceoleosa TaxID=1840588 RepID=A0ACC0HG32_9ERIC|nr:hypothetical protein LOK49_LG06G02257 [Camellia lanceoleosa]